MLPPRHTIFESACFPQKSSDVHLPDYAGDAITDSTGSRKYVTPLGNHLPSVSTVMGYSPDKEKSLDEWRDRVGVENAKTITNQSNNIGTALHNCMEHYLANHMTCLNKEYSGAPVQAQMMFKVMKKFVDKHVQCVYYQEKAVYSERLGIAGRLDVLCGMNDSIIILDFKNSRKRKKRAWVENYFLQSTAYASIVSEWSGQDVSHFVIPIITFDGELQVFTGEVSKYQRAMKDQICKYYDEVWFNK